MSDNILHTDCLQLRPITKADAKAVYKYRSDSNSNQFQTFIPVNIDEVYQFIDECAQEIDEEEAWFQLVIIHSESNSIIGDIGIHNIDEAQVELGITIAPDYQHKGYATEALITVIDLLFQQLNKHRIIASVDPNNTASAKLFEKIGFRKEAHFVESFYHEGKWLDDVQYGLLNKEWDK